ncbi:unnamed protein product, partial [Phaeothamnion confervicola]
MTSGPPGATSASVHRASTGNRRFLRQATNCDAEVRRSPDPFRRDSRSVSGSDICRQELSHADGKKSHAGVWPDARSGIRPSLSRRLRRL